MLILTRRIGEALMIGDSVIVTVCGIRRKRAHIGITAPISVAVHRKENLRGHLPEEVAEKSLPLEAVEQSRRG